MSVILISTGYNTYSAAQAAPEAITVQELIDELSDLAEEHGADAPVVVITHGRGAVYEPVMSVYEDQDSED